MSDDGAGRRAPGTAEVARKAASPDHHVEQPGPAEFRDPVVAEELKRASVWIGLAVLVLAVFWLAQPLLLIFAGIVLASMLDGGTRLLGRVLPIGRGWRLAIVTLAAVGSIIWLFYFTGVTLAGQAERLREVVTTQINQILAWANRLGLVQGGVQVDQLSQQLMGSLGRLTSAVGSALGAVTSLIMILVIGIFIAVEPRLYERGFAWMLPMGSRQRFYRTTERMGWTLRRLMAGRLVGMAFEGAFTAVLLTLGGVPMAMLLGIITGLLAFIPNIGAIISGVLMVLVGFSAGTQEGIWAIVVYFAVQNIDGYLIVPYIARKTVDLPPALVLGAQLLLGALFGIMGLALADPIVAMIKAGLEQKSRDDVPGADVQAQAAAAGAAEP
jgi:predicted PurR-regulated permease PerM